MEPCFIGLVCWYNLIFDTVVAFGRTNAMFVLAATTLFPAYVLALLSKELHNRFFPKVAWYLSAFALTLLYGLGFWAITLLLDSVPLSYISLALLPVFLIFIFLVFPLHLVYRKVMVTYPELPWYAVAFALCFLGSVVLWAVLLLVFGLFTIS